MVSGSWVVLVGSWWLAGGGWWLVAGGWWLVAGWLVAGGWWLVAGGWWLDWTWLVGLDLVGGSTLVLFGVLFGVCCLWWLGLFSIGVVCALVLPWCLVPSCCLGVCRGVALVW